MARQWPDLWEEYFREPLDDERSRLWFAELDRADQTGGTSNDELCEAIRFGSRLDRSKYAGKPALKDLRIWIFMYRKENRAEGAMRSDDGEEGYMRRLKGAMRQAAPDRNAIWEIICNPRDSVRGVTKDTTRHQCLALEAWARDALGFERPKRTD